MQKRAFGRGTVLKRGGPGMEISGPGLLKPKPTAMKRLKPLYEKRKN